MEEKNPFEKYILYVYEDGKIVGVNSNAIEFAEETFDLNSKSFTIVYYGSINEDENLISIHTGGWSENEYLISEFKETGWWFQNHKITAKGGHYYFDTDFQADKKWEIKPVD